MGPSAGLGLEMRGVRNECCVVDQSANSSRSSAIKLNQEPHWPFRLARVSELGFSHLAFPWVDYLATC